MDMSLEGPFDFRTHRAMVKTILSCDDYHAERVHRRMRSVTPELDYLSIVAFIALCQQMNYEVRHAA